MVNKKFIISNGASKIILASTSPRRKQLHEMLEGNFKVVDSGYKEVIRPRLGVAGVVKFLALGKAKAAAKQHPNSIIIAADTVVELGGKILGKPHTAAKAKVMLKQLSGKAHYIFTGVAVINAANGQEFLGVDKVKVVFRKLSGEEINSYVATKEPLDRAGAYALQGIGFKLIKEINGDLTTAIGLPMSLVYNGLQQLGIKH